MCLLCHIGAFGTNEQPLYDQLDVTDDKIFGFNSTSVSHVLIAATGLNGQRCRERALDLLQRFISLVRSSPELFSEFWLEAPEKPDVYERWYTHALNIAADRYPTDAEGVNEVLKGMNGTQ